MILLLRIHLALIILLTLGVEGNKQELLGDREKRYENDQFPFLPYPKKVQMSEDVEENQLHIDPCLIQYSLPAEFQKFPYFLELIEDQQYKSFKCHISHIVFDSKNSKHEYLVKIKITDPTLRGAVKVEEEKYSVSITKEGALIQAEYYPGFVRGLQTFIQAIQCPRYSVNGCKLRKLPIAIEDFPSFQYRSLMIDTSRHFLPMKTIYQTVDALMYNKMNVLHWHVVDEDSFPLILRSHPQLAQFGAFSEEETYTMDEAQHLIHYAMVRGVRIVPEIDTPGHSANWKNAPTNKGVSCLKKEYRGGLDVTLSKTYDLVQDVFRQIMEVFPDPILHVGGDEFQISCFENITQFFKAHGLNQTAPHENLQIIYEKKQKQILRSINQTKRFVYWARQKDQLKYINSEQDIIQWWPFREQESLDVENNVILSIKNYHYLDLGVGNRQGVPYKKDYFPTWLDYFENPLARVIEKNGYRMDKIMGAGINIWSEINNQYTHHMKVWIRGSAFADDIWGTPHSSQVYKFLTRLTAHERLMNRRGIPTAPATSQYCQFQPIHCDKNKKISIQAD